MEVAKIDWEDSKFEKDDVYEHINAPQWVDFSAPDDDPRNSDVSWFCRSDCNHPNSVEDFFKQKTPNSSSKLWRSASVSEVLPLGDRNRRDVALKKRGIPQPTIWSGKSLNGNGYIEDAENEKPNMSTPLNHKAKLMKESIKSSAEKNLVDIPLDKEETPRLKSTLSARNLFAGRDILNQITDFCTELKRLATRAKEREDGEKENVKKTPVAAVKKQGAEECSGDNLRVLRERENEKKPLLEARKEKCEEKEKSGTKEKLRRKKRNEDAENTPPVSVDLKTIRRHKEENLLHIRTNPPSPQCFSASRAPIKTTPPTAFRPRPPEKSMFRERGESNTEVKKEEAASKAIHGRNAAVVAADREARALDVFWFLKPCTLSS